MDEHEQEDFSGSSSILFEGELLDTSDDQFSGSVLFIAANDYGLSAKTWNGEPMKEGDRLINKRNHRDIFRIEHHEDNIITIESMTVQGLFIGLGRRSGEFGRKNPFNAVLVNPKFDEDRHKLRMVSAINGWGKFYASFEPISQPGYVLNHCGGNMYFSKVPNWPNEDVFKQDSSWKMRMFETMEEMVMRLPSVCVRQSSSSAQECPICLELWQGPKCVPVMTKCGHIFCLQCISKITTGHSANESLCPMCRSRIKISDLKRVLDLTQN
mmetsp:Transcript_18858/g.43002  ORF Transcript_18858/g.43002 Transcript_18858/m.43002 type:complete len:269 (-) Transcript_18858:66-872(-)|eukprot:CAMPEP_0113314884 /NCGR_PEP_ID=MMETSP0010_2-20120614/10764_1 /TAXON_ID=216773 ORGANISM="Corethron hystrix, Strain 308" /NCGR_SAMPLE_ID=MMETSP0010_2 /ASSEMBLY_ACC=CAM_ASM_000155 /LENGTH=268 /DNA_ID=CAMNT_0000171255 /DNA_START=24 /DNA_END=830 /DNA_ORIENTATION=- /assembly_acc=CAM_ASM_000155